MSSMNDFSRMYAVNGINLHVIEKGEKGWPVLLFLHGFPEFWYGWHNQIDYFVARGYRVIVPDQRGYNLSSKPKRLSSYRITALAEDIAGLIKATGKDKVFITGHDWGGAVAWTMAYLYPDMIRKLIIINMPHPRVFFKTVRSDLSQVMRSWYIGFFQIPRLPEKVLGLYQYKMLQNSLQRTSLPGTFSPADLRHYRAAWQQKDALHCMIKWYRAAMRHRNPLATYHRKTEVPLLLIWGQKDKFLKKEMATQSLAYCQNGHLHTFPDATHWVHHEKSDEVNVLIEGFIKV